MISEEHIVIGKDRHITVPEALRRIAVQYDHNIETVTFDCPRFWDEHDMSKMTIYIAYMRKDRYRDKDVAEKVTIDASDPNLMHFDWTVSKNATMTKGELKILVCIVQIDDDGNEVVHWNSELNNQMYVSEGMECNDYVVTLYSDVITDLLVRMDNIHNANGPILDTSLTEKGLAADAKAAGDAIRQLSGELSAKEQSLRKAVSDEAVQRKAEVAVERERISKIVALQDGSTTGDAELMDARLSFDGVEYSTAGDSVRGQVGQVQNNVDNLYDNVISMMNDGTMSIHPIWEPGGIDGADGDETSADNRYRSRGYIKTHAPKLTINVGENLEVIIFGYSFSDGVFTIMENLSAVGEKTINTEHDYYRFVVRDTVDDVIDDPTVLSDISFVFTPESSYIRDEYFDRVVDSMNDMIINQRYLMTANWVIGGIDGGTGNTNDATNRIRTVDFYKPLSSPMHFEIDDGYRLLVYVYDENQALNGTMGYYTGNTSIDVDTSNYFKFVLRGVEDFDFTGDEYGHVCIYSDISSESDSDTDIPEYWQDTLLEKEQAIKQIVIGAAKNDNDIAMFYTIADPHYPSNSKMSTNLRRYLSEHCGITLSVQLGDFIQDSIVSHEEGLQFIQDAMKASIDGTDRLIITQGNHDNNAGIVDGNNQILAERIIYDNEWIHHTSSKLLSLPGVVFDEKRKAFYYDDHLQKIRFISIDSFEDKTYDIVDGIVTDYNLGRPSDRQMEWIRDVALATVPNGYSVVSFSHLSLFPPYVYNGREYVTVPHGGIGNGTTLVDIFTNFKNNGGTYVGHFAGHLHHDFLSTKDGITCVANLNDGTHWREASYFGADYDFVGDAPKKTIGTVSECAFDVVITNLTTRHVDLIRIGAGEDRSFDY